jgi:long-chain acyl-CoA synthetase
MARILPLGKALLFSVAKRSSLARIPRDERHVRFGSLVRNDGLTAPHRADPSDLAVLQYTGGTTGRPKGAMLTHANISANVEQTRLWLTVGGTRDDREVVLGVLPLFHVFGMTVLMNTALDIGAELVLLPRFEAADVARTVHKRRITILPGVPTMFGALAETAGRGHCDFSSVRTGFCGAAPLPVDVKQRFETLAGCAVVEGYGLTEASPLVACNPVTGVHKPNSIGLPVTGTVVDIVSLEDGRTVLPPGERGEICVRGPQVMRGYWNRPEETAETLEPDGRLHTGDIGTMDEDGYVFLLDRLKDLIIAGGYNVYPHTVEEAVYAHPAVAECVVAGVPDPYRGQTVKAYVTLHEGESLTLEQLDRFLEDRLSAIERPKLLEVRDSLPRTLIGKLSRRTLLDEEAERADRGEPPAG